MEAKTMTLKERLKWNAELTIRRDLSLGMNALLLEAATALEEAERALEPFAKAGGLVGPNEPDGVGVICYAGDLRLARSVRDKLKGGE